MEKYLRFQYKRDAHTVWAAGPDGPAAMDPNFHRNNAFSTPKGKVGSGPWSKVRVATEALPLKMVVIGGILSRGLLQRLLAHVPPASTALRIRLAACGADLLSFMSHMLRAAACTYAIRESEQRAARDPTYMHVIVDYKV